MEIKVLGTGCAGCKALHETVKQAVAELGLAATVVKEEDIVKIMSYNVCLLYTSDAADELPTILLV